ncbi:hypothetical protein CPAR01_14253 [Colletotrichum paranaense]|uniref:Zn(2)-C6 fungal-type domain-containing protein n=1 Tax=Colletotrichum paranaense TaxID=1914294 RepID=A0ABQ9S1N8_9PEZI|nr:uncharacterized protein CPAR01_14253 [Colletotrichum paranaense]KAK1522710.1 hypothetical protein CPAR01_14253 [Colletotrichum paranaense]
MADANKPRLSLPKDADARRSRSFGGCGTTVDWNQGADLLQCRNRRMKCDEGRPTCSMCRASNLTCSGYEKNIFFDFEEIPSVGMARFRRPLLTESERESMSDELVSSIPPALTLWHIAQIEDECERAPLSQSVQISRGPFGAFRVHRLSMESSKAAPESSPESNNPTVGSPPKAAKEIGEDSPEEADEELMNPPDGSPAQETTPLLGPALACLDYRPLSPLTEWWNTNEWWNMGDLPDASNWWDTPVELDRVRDISDNVSFSGMEQYPRVPIHVASQDVQVCIPSMFADTQSQQLSTPENCSIAPAIDYAVPHDAVFLLRHYSTTVLRGFTPFRHSKTPWHILFIPYVKSCLAALTLGDDMDHASLTAFYGTLAISASSLGGISNSRKWSEQANNYKQRARHHVRLMLQTAYDVPKKAKYKSILIAFLTMVQISSVSGSRDQVECYLLEAEKFIRVKGLNRKKSRKVRLLHHCYAFERVLHETTFPGSTQSPHRLHVRKVIETSNASAYSIDSLSFQLASWSNLDQEMLKVKGREEGENDLHLQIPGVWLATLYPEIFGIPEIYIFLLSLVIRLARSKEDPEYSSPAGLKEFMFRAKAVERRIHQLRRQPGYVITDLPTSDPEMQHCQQFLDNLSQAMLLALTIFFYRRVYDVEADMLQDKVVGVRDCLLRFEATESEMGYGSARLVWPAVIAASEADDPEVRESFAQFFRDWARRSGLRIFSDSLADVERRWAEKECVDSGGATEAILIS